MNTRRNINLWINNDEGLYRLALDCVRQYRHWSSFSRSMTPRERAAHAMLDRLHMAGITHTPDGSKYSVTSIRAAMVGMNP